MVKYALIVALLGQAVLGAQFMDAHIKQRYDRFKDATYLELSNAVGIQDSPGPFTLNVSLFSSGKELVDPMALIAFLRAGRDWQYVRCYSVAMLIDGKPGPEFESKHTGQATGGSNVLEMISVNANSALFRQIASAKKVEVQICNTEFELSTSNVELLAKMASHIKEK